MVSRNFVSEKEIEEALNYVALLIDWYGDAYWPIFDRLEQELEERKSKNLRLKSRLKGTENAKRNLNNRMKCRQEPHF